LRGIVLGADLPGDGEWVRDATGAVLPGLRVVGEGGDVAESVELLAQSPVCWVGRIARRGSVD
jgi:hypothetical protein